MPLSTTEKTQLQASVQALTDEITALVVDPDVNPLQAALDAANATITALQGKIDATKTALAAVETADAAEDTARAAALAALG